MSIGMNAVKWAGKWVLQLPAYFVTSYAVRTLMGSCYRILIRGGANLPPNFLLQHFLWVALVGGFVAGLAGLLLFRAMLLLPMNMNPVSGSVWKRPQAWTWILPTCVLAFGMMAWFGGQTHHSVLASSTVTGRASILGAFFGSGCSIPATIHDYGFFNDCMNQITFTHPWLGTLGYSAAAFLPSDWFGKLRHKTLPQEEAGIQEQAQEIEVKGQA
jgi:hypothetical protein